MDEKRLRARMLRLYTITTALILAAVFAAVALLSVREARQSQKDTFLALFTAVAEGLQTDTTVSHSTLRKYEQNNRMLFLVEDAGNTLRYNSEDGTKRTQLLEKVIDLAKADGVDIAAVPLTAQRRTSPVYRIREGGAEHYGAVSVIPVGSTFRALVATKQADDPWLSWQTAVYGAGYLFSVLVLCLLGAKLIDRALRPAVESRARQTEFIAAASHELRSPLAVIRANAAFVTELPERAAQASATIDAECCRLSKLIGDMLLLASADAKNWPVTLAPLEPDTLLLNVYESYTPVCRKRGAQLVLTLPEEPLPPIKADAERLAQVLGILLDNAMHYSAAAQDKTVELRAHRDREQLVLEVVDHGAGIPQEQKLHIFERFYRGDTSHSDKQHFGLGLAIAKELIALHGGSILVDDTPCGGSTFVLSLPIA